MEQKPEIEEPKKCNWCNQNMNLHYFGEDGLMCPISSDHVASSVNDTGTDQKIDTPETQPSSLDVHGWQPLETAPRDACKNTDRELWRGPDEGGGDYYADSIFITKEGAFGINCGGSVYVKPIREWHRIAGGPIT
jgi:hypothetical protein